MLRRVLSPFNSLRRLSLWAVPVLAVLTILVYSRFTAFTLLAVGVLAGVLAYAVLGPHEVGGDDRIAELTVDDPRVPGVLTVGFFLAISVALSSLATAYYTKPLTFYSGVALAAGVLVIRVILTDAHATNLALAFVYGGVTFVSNQIAFPLGLNGPDIGDHVGLATTIRETGHVAGGGVYNGFPAQHVLAAGTAAVAGTGTRETYLAIGIAGMLLGLPVTYYLARTIGDQRLGVLAVVFVASMEYVVYRAGHPSKLAYAIPLVLLVFACVVALYRKRTPGMVFLFGLFSTALVFTHHHSAFVALLMLGALGIGQAVAPRLIEYFPPTRTPEEDPSAAADGGRLPDPGVSRGHVLALLFGIAFVAQFLYYSQFFDGLVSIAQQYVDILLVLGEQDPTKETPRFSTIPTETVLLNTVGSGILAGLAALGALDHVERRIGFSMAVLGWLGLAAVVMVFGVVLRVPFALPNRVYVLAEVTGVGLFGAAGILYLLRTARARQLKRVAMVAIAVVLVGFAFFSTASTIAGIETSPFNEDVPHRTWYGMVEEEAASDTLAVAGVDEEQFRWARSFSVTDDGRIDYSTATPGTVIVLNEHKIESGVNVQGGQGQIGTGVFVFPTEIRNGLDRRSKVYDNGAIEAYAGAGDPGATNATGS